MRGEERCFSPFCEVRGSVAGALLILEDGSLFRGVSVGASGFAVGEVVFNTAMSGYQEILTDPSYARQIVTLTTAHVGNTGVNPEDNESQRVWAEALIVRDVPSTHESWRAEQSLPEFLKERNVVAIADIDTRRLTKLIREKGALAGCVATGDADLEEALARAREFPGLAGMDLAQVVSRDDIGVWDEGTWSLESGYSRPGRVASGATQKFRASETSNAPARARHHVVACDYGVKRNILRMLVERGCRVTVVPARTTAEEILALEPDGVFLSNGPGDPDSCDYAIAAIGDLLGTGIPIFGICLGHQLLSLASGARTVKMPHGHHGANHPVKDLADGRVIITSQNHGFAVDGDSLPAHLKLTHVSLFDGTVQGASRTDVPAFGFQGHPEASPGPRDCGYLFDRFVAQMQCAKETGLKGAALLAHMNASDAAAEGPLVDA